MSKHTTAPTAAQTTEDSAPESAPQPVYRVVADTARKAMQRSQLYRVTSGFYEALAVELGFEKGVVDTMLTRWIDAGSRIALRSFAAEDALGFALPEVGEPPDALRAKFVAFIDSADFPVFEAMEAAVRDYDSAGGSPLSYAAGEQAKTDPN